MTDAFVLSGVRVTHRHADLETLEAVRYADPDARVESLLGREGVEEAIVLQTCNRVEEYVVTNTPTAGSDVLADFPAVPDDTVVSMGHTESLRHVLRVAAGLESQVLGEDEVLGQVRAVYNRGIDHGWVGDVLEPALLKAIHVGERARTETAINEGVVSLGSAAIDLAEREGGLDDGSVLIVGAGDMARTVAKALPPSVTDLTLANRTVERATDLSARLDRDADTTTLERLPAYVEAADVVVTTTASSEPLVDAAIVREAGETLVIDLGQPRDVASEVDAIDTVSLYDLDDLRSVTERTHDDRREAAREVEAIVEEEVDLLLEQYKRARADAVIAAMHQGGERIKRAQLEHALAKLEDDLTEDQREVVESLADSLVSQLLAVPTESLRDAAAEDDWETVATALDLFDPSVEAEVEHLFEREASDGATAGGSDD